MKLLYGVVGEGMGHATRSRVVIEHLVKQGHDVRVVVSGRAHRFLTDRLPESPKLSVEEIGGLTLAYEGNRVDRSASVWQNLRAAPDLIERNINAYRDAVASGFQPELVFSDFESWAALYALNHFLPVVSIDNMQIINRCQHPRAVTSTGGIDYRIAKLAVKSKIPGAYHYLVSSFFFPPVRKKRTTLVPPILRPRSSPQNASPAATSSCTKRARRTPPCSTR